MVYLSIVVYFFGVTCQALLFWRGWRWGGWRAFPFFYTYLSYTSLKTVVLPFFPHAHPLYPTVYWDSELVAAVVRFLVAWEVFRGVFSHNSLRRIVGGVTFGALILLALAFWLSGPSPGTSVIIDFMRKMALSAGVWTVVVLAVALLYGIRIGQNIWGMAIGFLIFVSWEVANFAAFDLIPWPMWRYLRPFAYVFMLVIWTWSLWDYAPNPQSEMDSSLASLLFFRWKGQSAALDQTIRKITQP